VNERLQKLVDAYSVAFQDYLSEPQERALTRAYELGRTALAEGLGVFEIAIVHSRISASVLARPLSDAERVRLPDALERFFVEALSPFEMAHRGFREANSVLRRLNEMLEAQAKRIASTLHDETAQLLASAHLGLADLARKLPAERGSDVQHVRGILDEAEQRLRNLSHELRPPILDDLGLVPALEFLADSVSKRWSVPVIVRASMNGDLPGTIETTLYRIAQEALTNVAKHAHATEARVHLRRTAHKVVCSVRDNGVGLGARGTISRSHRRGLGLVTIKERVASLGGTFRLDPNRGRGTTLTVELPLEH
jgi:signal transduction histidine kinase